MAPTARLLYLFRDPFDRAMSQYRHHRREGDERRAPAEALLDPTSHYVRRSRYCARLQPFLDRFPSEQIAVVDHQDLLRRTAATVAAVCHFIGAPPNRQPDVFDRRLNAAGAPPDPVGAELATAYRALVADDVAAFERVRRGLRSTAPR